jgi:hypothetical protein
MTPGKIGIAEKKVIQFVEKTEDAEETKYGTNILGMSP